MYAASLTGASVVVRPAEDREARACRLLMPETFALTHAPELWVAIDPATSRIAGAAALVWRPLLQPPGFPMQVHVVPPLRRRGIGTAIVEAVVRACAGNTQRIHGWATETEGSSAAAFLQAVGFAQRRRLIGFKADGPRFYAMIKTIYDRIADKIPESFQIIPLSEARRDDVAALIAGTFHDISLSTAMGIARGFVGYDTAKSVVLLDGGEVKGALLYSWNGGDPLIDVRVVAPELRRGTANVLLLEAATRNGLEGGARHFSFHSEESVRDTMSLARRSGATPIGAKLAFSRVLSNLG